MPLNERDLSYLLDMVSSCQDIMEFVADVSFEQFERDKMRRLATERQLEILGEAANHVSPESQQEYSDIDWSRIIGLRNKLAHDYGEVLAQRVWQITVRNVPDLLRKLLSIDDVSRLR